MVPESFSATPLVTDSHPPTPAGPSISKNPQIIPLAKIPSLLKRLAREPPPSGFQPVKRLKVLASRKKAPQVPLQDSVEEGYDRGPSSEEGKGCCSRRPSSPYDGRYLAPPYRIPNLEVTREAPWNTRKFHFHTVKPLLNKKVAATYSPLKNPYAALNYAFILTKRNDLLTHDNRTVEKKIEILKKVNATKNELFNCAKKDLIIEREERAKLSEAGEERDQKLEGTLAEVNRLKEESVEVEKNAMQARYKELEMSSVGDLERTT
ncbi:hypothetical protein LIER_33358 [Lithospermum erythrorhizon]|uniref:Uncharacterized protein n=1 Tax=Lithospermum erythrorhizon TaxID=34254 RepID=A0AAV3RYZ6_LITER